MANSLAGADRQWMVGFPTHRVGGSIACRGSNTFIGPSVHRW